MAPQPPPHPPRVTTLSDFFSRLSRKKKVECDGNSYSLFEIVPNKPLDSHYENVFQEKKRAP